MKNSKYSAFPYIIFMCIFIIIPLFIVVYYAFTNADGNVSFDNILRVSNYLPIIVKSLYLAMIATIICLFLGYPFAYLMSKTSRKTSKIMFMLIMLPMWMNFLLRTYSWMTLLENNGLINKFLSFFGIGPLSLINTQGAVILGMVYDYLPFMIIPLYTVLIKMDKSLIEAAQDLGANKFKTFINVILPLSVPGINTGVIMVFIPAVSTFIISRMLGGGSEMMIGDLIEMQFTGNTYNINLGAAISFVLMVIILICMRVFNQFGNDDQDIKDGRFSI